MRLVRRIEHPLDGALEHLPIGASVRVRGFCCSLPLHAQCSTDIPTREGEYTTSDEDATKLEGDPRHQIQGRPRKLGYRLGEQRECLSWDATGANPE